MEFRPVCSLLMGLAFLAGSLGAARPAKTAPELKWTTVRSEHFTVLSASDTHVAERWALDLERFERCLAQLLPVHPERLTPVTVVVFPDEPSFRPYKLLEAGKPAEIGGYFARSDAVNVIGLARDIDPFATRRVIFHEAAHWVSSARDEALPLWLEEGMAEMFSTFMADEKQFMIGDTIVDHVQYFRANRLPLFRELFGASQDKINYSDRKRTGRFYAGSWLFAHWLTFGENSPGPAALQRYLEALKSASDSEAAFVAAFGGGYQAVEQRLQVYLMKGHYRRQLIPMGPAPLEISPPRPATEAEVEFALGSLLTSARGPVVGRPHLQRAAQLEPGDPRAWEVLGFAELSDGRKEEALAAFDRAAQAGSRLAMVWNNRAALRQQVESPAGEFLLTQDREGLTAAAKDFRRALELDPHCKPAYAGLAGVVYGTEPVDAEDVARFERGRAAFPDDQAIALGHALARLRSPQRAEGEAELKNLLEADRHLPLMLRRVGENAIEGERLKVLSEHIALYSSEERYGELIAELDAAMADPTISARNRQPLRPLRTQADQLLRMGRALTAFNAGDHPAAGALAQAVLDEPPANASIRRAALQLVQLCKPGADE